MFERGEIVSLKDRFSEVEEALSITAGAGGNGTMDEDMDMGKEIWDGH